MTKGEAEERSGSLFMGSHAHSTYHAAFILGLLILCFHTTGLSLTFTVNIGSSAHTRKGSGSVV